MAGLVTDPPQGLTCKNVPQKCLSVELWYYKHCCVNGGAVLFNGIVWAATTMNCAKFIKPIACRSWCGWLRNTFMLQAEEPFEKFLTVAPNNISTNGGPTLLCYASGEAKGQRRVLLLWKTLKPRSNRHKLVIRCWKSTSHTGKEHELVLEAKS